MGTRDGKAGAWAGSSGAQRHVRVFSAWEPCDSLRGPRDPSLCTYLHTPCVHVGTRLGSARPLLTVGSQVEIWAS